MDEKFLQRANGIELRLEAEGFHLTAIAMRQVIDSYIQSHTHQKPETLYEKSQNHTLS